MGPPLFIKKMKRLSFLIICALFPLQLLSQNKQLDFEATLPDSVKYYVPEFATGRIVYTDGGFSTGKLNICTVDQSVRFIDDKGEVMSLSNVAQVDRVSIGPFLFLKNGNEFAAVVSYAEDVSLVVTKKFVFERDKKKGAFGATSETTNISSVSSASSERGQVFAFSSDVEYRIDTTPYLYKKSRFYPVTKKNLLKFFPNQKEQVEAYLDSHPANFQRVEELEAFFASIK